MLISEICQYFLLKKCELLHCIYATKNISVFGYKVIKHLTVDLLTSSLSLPCFEQLGPGIFALQCLEFRVTLALASNSASM